MGVGWFEVAKYAGWSMKDPRRRFTKSQAAAKLAACGGLCERCGKALENGFHMHHAVEHGRGGRTILTNCLALCPSCHRGVHHGRA